MQSHHFADDTNLLLSDYSFRKLNKHTNRDLKLVNELIRANKLSLNLIKTETVIFNPKNKNINKCLNFRMSGQKIKLNKQIINTYKLFYKMIFTGTVIYLLMKKLSRAIGLLSKVRHYASKYLLRTYSLFNSHLIYVCEMWGLF